MLSLIAAGGLLFAFEHATIAGKLVLLLLAIVSIFSWSVMVTKLRVIQFARKQNARFLFALRQDRQTLRLFETDAGFAGPEPSKRSIAVYDWRAIRFIRAAVGHD